MKRYFYPADILIPDFRAVDGYKWASVACDQYTGAPEYWERAFDIAEGSPSTLNLMLPEAFLDREEEMLPKIEQTMKDYLKNVLCEHKSSMIYLERTQEDGRVRRGLVGAVDLEEYDFNRGSSTLIRATEGTVPERIPPRVKIRRGAVIEMPHILVLIDDPERTVIEPIAENAGRYKKAYDFDLMASGGHVKGYFVDEDDLDKINSALEGLTSEESTKKKYGLSGVSPLLFAIGDGNHSLASAKTLYEEIKAEIGEERAKAHPARYALCEIENLHDDAIEFEPIYRVVFGVEPELFIEEFEKYTASLKGSAEEQRIEVFFGGNSREIAVAEPVSQLAVGTVQNFLDAYLKENKSASADYIHGIEEAKLLAQKEKTVALLFDGMTKDMLFKTVICDGALPRKTFSMGHAHDKRYYIECRGIR